MDLKHFLLEGGRAAKMFMETVTDPYMGWKEIPQDKWVITRSERKHCLWEAHACVKEWIMDDGGPNLIFCATEHPICRQEEYAPGTGAWFCSEHLEGYR